MNRMDQGHRMDSPTHELGGPRSEALRRIELRPGARPFIPQRDLLVGDATEQRRHRLARVALLRRLLAEPIVQHDFDDWTTLYGLRQPLERATTRLDALVKNAGLSSRAALFSPDCTCDPVTEQGMIEAAKTFLDGMTGNGVPLVLDAGRLGEQLVTILGLSPDCRQWLTRELLAWFFLSLLAQIEDRAITLQYTEVPFPQVVTGPTESRLRQESPKFKKKMPNNDGRYIATYVEWLVQNRLHGVRVRALARALLSGEGDVLRSPNYDARHRVQYGIKQARTWLNGGVSSTARAR
jgi:hypothetical protein